MPVLAFLRAAIARPSWLTRLFKRAWRSIWERFAAREKRTAWATSALDAFIAVLTVHVVIKGTTFLASLLFPPARPRPFAMPFAHWILILIQLQGRFGRQGQEPHFD